MRLEVIALDKPLAMSAWIAVAIGVALSAASDLHAQSAEPAPPTLPALRAGRRVPLPVDEEVVLARSAAPPSISANARVLMLADSGWVAVAHGSSDVTCVVNRSWNRSVEPHCYDAEGSATVMCIELHRNWLRHRGRPEVDVDREIAAMIQRGALRLPRRPAMSYMMSPRQILHDDSGRYVGRWRPHIMLYYPKLTNAAVGLPARPDMLIGMVAGEGTPESSLIIIMSAYSDGSKSP
jgi:hypothetical protein